MLRHGVLFVDPFGKSESLTNFSRGKRISFDFEIIAAKQNYTVNH